MKIVAFSALVLMAFAITTTVQQQDSTGAANNQPGHLKDMIKPFSLSQLNLSTSRNYSEEGIYRQLNSICEILEYINTLNGLHTNYEHKYNGSRLTEVAALIAAGAQVQKDVCSWMNTVQRDSLTAENSTTCSISKMSALCVKVRAYTILL